MGGVTRPSRQHDQTGHCKRRGGRRRNPVDHSPSVSRHCDHFQLLVKVTGEWAMEPRRHGAARAYRLFSRSSISAFISRISLRWLSMIWSASLRTRGSAIRARSLVRIAIEWCGIIAFI